MGSTNREDLKIEPPSDNKKCNMLQPCAVVPSIVQDPNFRIQTALLWIRSNELRRRRTATKSLPPGSLSDLAQVRLTDTIDGASASDVISSIQDDSPDLGLLHLHRDRLAAAAESLGWRDLDGLHHSEDALARLRAEIDKHMESRPPLPPKSVEAYKIRVLIDRVGNITVDSAVIDVQTPLTSSKSITTSFMPLSLDQPWKADKPLCKVYLDRQPTRPSPLTTHKSTHRCVYTSARERLNMKATTPPTTQEVLIYNPYGEVIETSCCTVYFKRDEGWITPAAICGPTLGVSRRLAIENGLCKQGTIELNELKANEEVWLSNAVRGFFKGILMTNAKRLSESAESEEVTRAKMNASMAAEHRRDGSSS